MSGEHVLFLSGDVMLGRGIDQVLARPLDPALHEEYVTDARRYVELAEHVSGPIPRGVGPAYVWGDALDVLREAAPAARLINLETAVTTSDDWWRHKGVHYRTHPDHVACLTAARIDCCTLANNHVLDWGYAGLSETLATLKAAGVRTVGAGAQAEEAWTPAALPLPGGGRLLVCGVCSRTSGVPPAWAAGPERAGVALLEDLSPASARALGERCRAARRSGDLVLVSIHWGPNWGYEVPDRFRRFAHTLIDDCGVDLIHGHSSHHVMGIEVHGERLVLYGCGDLLNDYEGIGGQEEYRPDLALMYFPSLDAAGRLRALRLVPTRTRRFQVRRAQREHAAWLAARLTREGFGTRAELEEDGSLSLRW